jgi:hypothetical protein
MDKNKLRETFIRFYATMNNMDYDSAVAAYQGKTPSEDGDIDSKLYTAVETAVASLLAKK